MRENDAAVAVEQLCVARLRRSRVSIRNQIESLCIVESSDSDHCAGTDGPPRKIHARCLRSGGCSLSIPLRHPHRYFYLNGGPEHSVTESAATI